MIKFSFDRNSEGGSKNDEFWKLITTFLGKKQLDLHLNLQWFGETFAAFAIINYYLYFNPVQQVIQSILLLQYYFYPSDCNNSNESHPKKGKRLWRSSVCFWCDDSNYILICIGIFSNPLYCWTLISSSNSGNFFMKIHSICSFLWRLVNIWLKYVVSWCFCSTLMQFRYFYFRILISLIFFRLDNCPF